MTTSTWTVRQARPDDPDAAALLWRYYAEIVGRWHRRPAQRREVAEAMSAFPSDDLAPPTGVLLVADRGGAPSGCAGLRWRPGWAELTRLFVDPAHRGLGGGAALLAEVERRAGAAGATRIRLDTRSDLVEARALYARHGYAEIPAFNDDPYAQHWFEKALPTALDESRAAR